MNSSAETSRKIGCFCFPFLLSTRSGELSAISMLIVVAAGTYLCSTDPGKGERAQIATAVSMQRDGRSKVAQK